MKVMSVGKCAGLHMQGEASLQQSVYSFHHVGPRHVCTYMCTCKYTHMRTHAGIKCQVNKWWNQDYN